MGLSAVGALRHEPPGNVVAVLETPRLDLEDEQTHGGREMARIEGQRLSVRRFRSPERFAPTGAVLPVVVVAPPERGPGVRVVRIDRARALEQW